MGALLISFLYALLTCAIVVFVAYCFVWALKWFGIGIDPDVFKWGKAIVALICIIVMLSWLLGALGVVSTPRLFLTPLR